MTQLTATVGGRPFLTAYATLTEDASLTFSFILFSFFVSFLSFLYHFSFSYLYIVYYKFEKGKEKLTKRGQPHMKALGIMDRVE